MLATGVTNSVFADVLRSLWDAFGTITGMVGLTPIMLLVIVAVLLFAAFGFQIYGAVTGRQSWSLEDDTAGAE